MELEPFSRIDTCGFAGLGVTSLKGQGLSGNVDEAADALQEILEIRLSQKTTDFP